MSSTQAAYLESLAGEIAKKLAEAFGLSSIPFALAGRRYDENTNAIYHDKQDNILIPQNDRPLGGFMYIEPLSQVDDDDFGTYSDYTGFGRIVLSGNTSMSPGAQIDVLKTLRKGNKYYCGQTSATLTSLRAITDPVSIINTDFLYARTEFQSKQAHTTLLKIEFNIIIQNCC